jgi:hypothetical protein
MKRPTRNDEGMYVIDGVSYPELFGSRTQVMNGNAYKTAGLLTKKDLFKNKRGYIVSLKKHKSASKEKRLEKAGWHTKKGTFGSFKKVKSKSKTMKNKKK